MAIHESYSLYEDGSSLICLQLRYLGNGATTIVFPKTPENGLIHITRHQTPSELACRGVQTLDSYLVAVCVLVLAEFSTILRMRSCDALLNRVQPYTFHVDHGV